MRPAHALLPLLVVVGAACHAPPRPSHSACSRPAPPAASSRWAAEPGRDGLEVRLVEPEARRPVRGGMVSLRRVDGGGRPLGALADSGGRVVFDTLPVGRYLLQARAVGYYQHLDTLDVLPARRWVGEILLPEHLVPMTDECGFHVGRRPSGTSGVPPNEAPQRTGARGRIRFVAGRHHDPSRPRRRSARPPAAELRR